MKKAKCARYTQDALLSRDALTCNEGFLYHSVLMLQFTLNSRVTAYHEFI